MINAFLNRERLENFSMQLLLMLAFFLPFKFLAPTLSSLLVIVWLLIGRFNERFKKRNTSAVFAFIAFYILHLVGMIYTENVKEGLFSLEVKMTLLFFPLIFSTVKFSEAELRRIVQMFVAGCFFSAFICILRALFLFIKTNDSSWFFYEKFCWFMHPSYYSMYFSLIIGIQTYYLLTADSIKRPILNLGILAFSFLIVLLSASKMGILCTGILVVLSSLSILLRKGKILLVLVFMGSTILAFFILMKIFPESFSRFQNTYIAINSKEIDKSTTESSGVRVLIWGAAKNVITSNAIIGTGTGDDNDELQKEYSSQGLSGALEKKLNAHNQFLQTWIGLGVAGLIALLVMLIYPIYKWKESPFILIYLVFLVLLNFTVETMLLTQAGTMFTAFFLSLFYFNRNILKSFYLFENNS